MTIDPRLSGIDARLEGVRRIVAVTGGKGGIGKSVVASTLALALAERGGGVGLLDLDLTSPSDHVILGAPTGFPEEEFGIEPSQHAGVAFMSISHFSGSAPVPLRGDAVTDALIELLAITSWGELETLVIDMPPGLGDTALDAVRLLRRAEYLVVATPSLVVRESVRRTLGLLRRLEARVAGVVENLRTPSDPEHVGELAAEFGLPLLGSLPRDEALESALGAPDRIRETALFEAVRTLASRLC